MGDGSGLAVSTFAGPSRDQPVRTKSAFLPSIDGALHATGAVLGRGARDLEFAQGVARLAPSGDGIKDDFYGGRSHLSEVHIASRLAFNSLRLGFEEISCFRNWVASAANFPASLLSVGVIPTTSVHDAEPKVSRAAPPARACGRGYCRPRKSPASWNCRRTPCACWCRKASDIAPSGRSWDRAARRGRYASWRPRVHRSCRN